MCPQRAAELVAPHLEPGERLVWSQSGPRLRLSLPLIVPFVFFASFTIAALAVMIVMLVAALRAGTLGGDWAGWAVPVALAGAGLLLMQWSWRGLRAGWNTVYAVTDRAALIVETADRPRVRRFGPQDIARRARFGDRIGFVPSAGDGNRFDSLTSFIGVRDMDTVEAALDRVAARS